MDSNNLFDKQNENQNTDQGQAQQPYQQQTYQPYQQSYQQQQPFSAGDSGLEEPVSFGEWMVTMLFNVHSLCKHYYAVCVGLWFGH